MELAAKGLKNVYSWTLVMLGWVSSMLPGRLSISTLLAALDAFKIMLCWSLALGCVLASLCAVWQSARFVLSGDPLLAIGSALLTVILLGCCLLIDRFVTGHPPRQKELSK
jgi:hypothetical protein